MRRKTTTPSAKWVASKEITILKKTSDMGHETCKSSWRTITSVSLDMTQFGVVCRRLLRTYMATGKRVLGYSIIGKCR
jgi:hypothetical protein